MKKITYHIIAILSIMGLALGFTSCDKFLTLTPTGKKFVNSIEDTRDVMGSYMLLLTDPNCPQINLFGQSPFVHPPFNTATLAMFGNELEVNIDNAIYYNKSRQELTSDGEALLNCRTPMDYMWTQLYETAGALNYIIIETDQVKSDNKVIHDMVKGEALVWRAFCYYKLLQYYAPYKDDRQGVPMSLNPVANVEKTFPKRQTQTAVFKQIISDCNEALDLLKRTPTQSWNVAYRTDFIHSMLADIYAYKSGSGAGVQGDWEQVLMHSEQAIKGRTLTSNVQDLKMLFDSSYQAMMAGLNASAREEYYFRLRNSYNSGISILAFKNTYFDGMSQGVVPEKNRTLFAPEDIRTIAYTSDNSGEMTYNKYNYTTGYTNRDNGGILMPFRVANAYLLKAEALIRKDKLSEGAKVLKDFMTARRPGATITLPADQEGLMKALYQERKREFYCEYDINWLDTKRMGLGIERTFMSKTYEIKPNDPRFTFLIPYDTEIDLNPNIEQN